MSFEQIFEDEYKKLEAERKEIKRRKEELAEIERMPYNKMVDFYCKRCDKDMKLLGRKRFTTYMGGRAWYETDCKCGSKLMRRINDKKFDPYFRESKRLREDRRRYWRELLQKDDIRYKRVYGDFEYKAEVDQEEKLRKDFNNK